MLSPNTRSRFYKDHGFKVNFKVLDDFDGSRKAFDNDEVDLLWCTIDAFPTEAGVRKGNPQIVFQADWSRGGDAIVKSRCGYHDSFSFFPHVATRSGRYDYQRCQTCLFFQCH